MIISGRAVARCGALAVASIAMMCPVEASAERPVITRSDAISIQLFPVVDPGACAQLSTANLIILERGKQDSQGPGPSALLIASGLNVCTGDFFSSDGFAQGISYVRNKESVKAQGTIVVTTRNDFSGVTFSEAIAFNVNVTASSTRASRNWGTNHFVNAGVKLSFQFDSEFRPASANGSLTGTLFGAPFSAGIDAAAMWFDDRNRAITRERIQ